MHTVRTTTGQSLTISYDAVTNTVHFREHGWFAEPLRAGGAPGTSPGTRRHVPPLAVLKRRRERPPTGRAA